MSRVYIGRNKKYKNEDENREFFKKLREQRQNKETKPKVIENVEYKTMSNVYSKPIVEKEDIKPIEKEEIKPLKKEDVIQTPKAESSVLSSPQVGVLGKRTYKRNYKCEICGKGFANPQALKTHKMFMHPTVK
ncbi:MAG: C2H2-type zinc finger protein [Caldisphaera sp.]